MDRYRALWMTLIGVVLVGGLVIGGLTPDSNQAETGETKSYDLDRDGVIEQYQLDEDRLIVSAAGQEIWRTPADWRVIDFALADATNDGRDELLLVLWKRGSYGWNKPYWYSQEDNQYTNHLFVYNMFQGKMHQSWCSSALDQPILGLSVTDADGDGDNELEVRENGGNTTIWRWRSWGFYQVDGLKQN